jgi:type III secretion system low calcium response chaperone LcrH/SycD
MREQQGVKDRLMLDKATPLQIDPAALSSFQKEALATLQAGGTAGDAVGLSAADIETIHRIGLSLLDQGKYEQAQPMFQFACLYAHNERRFWISLGDCRRMLKEYSGAIDAYIMGMIDDSRDPWPLIHVATCFLATNDAASAAAALKMAEQAMAKGTFDELVQQRVSALRQALMMRQDGMIEPGSA